MNDYLLRVLTARNLAVGAGTMVVFFGLLTTLPGPALRLYRQYHPPISQSGAPPPDIKDQLGKEEMRGLAARHRRVMEKLAAAEAQGFKVDRLRSQADGALAMGRAGARWKAQEVLNAVEMAVPHVKQRYIPLYPNSGGEDELIEPDVAPSKASAKKPAPAKPAKGSKTSKASKKKRGRR